MTPVILSGIDNALLLAFYKLHIFNGGLRLKFFYAVRPVLSSIAAGIPDYARAISRNRPPSIPYLSTFLIAITASKSLVDTDGILLLLLYRNIY